MNKDFYTEQVFQLLKQELTDNYHLNTIAETLGIYASKSEFKEAITTLKGSELIKVESDLVNGETVYKLPLFNKAYTYSSFKDWKKDKDNRENNEAKLLKTELKVLKQTLKDYPKIKRKSNIAYIVAIVLSIAQLVQIIMSLLK